MNTECPTCRTIQRLMLQWAPGAHASGSVIHLECGHAFELVPRQDLET